MLAVAPVFATAAPLLDGYDDVVDSLIARRVALGWSQEELDFRAGFSSAFTSHLETFRSPTGRRATDRTLERWMAALGVKLRLVIVEHIRPDRPRAVHRAYRRPA
jgi:hypothetical protein